MDPDVMLVLGSIIAAGTFPAAVSAFSSGEPPKLAFICILVGGGLLAGAVIQNPQGYSFGELPGIFLNVARSVVGA